jgi:Rps23 Pro-64 3,4-dihydroxylase Tpa1-like proline 4-hydroxylase
MSTEFKPANPEPLFGLDLGANGGVLAPTSHEQLADWIQKEINAWAWINNRSFGSHDQVLREAISLLASALAQAREAQQHRDSSPDHSKNVLRASHDSIRAIYLDRHFPHSSTPIFSRTSHIRSEYGDVAASFYAAARLDRPGTTYQPTELSAWKGLVEAITDIYGPIGPAKSKIKSYEESIDGLRQKLEGTIADSQTIFDQLHRNYQSVADEISSKKSEQEDGFSESQSERKTAFDDLTRSHQREFEAIRRTFTEELALRAPAEYWTSKRTAHRWIAGVSGIVSFCAIAACAFFLAGEIEQILEKTTPGTSPDNWRIAVLGLVSVFSVWAVRLMVRIFLSHMHLAGDSSERVVMLKTYLSLIEGGQLTVDRERQLILNALFRPASDGIVKDEGVPPSFLDILTRKP